MEYFYGAVVGFFAGSSAMYLYLAGRAGAIKDGLGSDEEKLKNKVQEMRDTFDDDALLKHAIESGNKLIHKRSKKSDG